MYDIFGLGNALVDTEVNVDDGFLRDQKIAKGHMTLIDSERMAELAGALDGEHQTRCSGGSAANTIYAAQAFGLKTGYTCKVAADETGDFFINELTVAGIDVNATARADQGRSGQCFILITPDAERSMNTDLGISSQLAASDVPDEALRNSRCYYVEGYLSSSPDSTAAAIHCREVSEEAGIDVAVTLSDPSMVEFFREPLESMLGNGVTRIFCNEEEALAWARTDRLEIAIAEIKDIAPEVYVTLSEKGSIAVSGSSQKHVPGVSVTAVDTTGAGDIYAGAALAARLKGAEPAEAARFANHCAAHIVTRYGARLSTIEDYHTLQKSFA